MDNLKKVGLTALGTVLVAGQAHAVTVGATAATSITFLGQDNGDDGNGWSMTDSVTFAASGESRKATPPLEPSSHLPCHTKIKSSPTSSSPESLRRTSDMASTYNPFSLIISL